MQNPTLDQQTKQDNDSFSQCPSIDMESFTNHGPFGELDAILANPGAHRRLPQVVWAFDPRLGVCRQVRWANPREPQAIRRTALAIARVEDVSRQWELN